MSTVGFGARVRRALPTGIAVVGFLMLALAAEHAVVLAFGLAAESGVETALYAATGAGLLGGWWWLRRSTVDADLRPRVGATTLAGALVLGGITFAIAVAGGAPLDRVFVDRVMLPVGVGALFGFPLGVAQVRAVTTARRATAAEVSQAHAEAERERFDYLNHLMRHDVLNAMSVVIGLAHLLEEDEPDPERRERLADIRRRSESVAGFISRMRTLVEATNPESPLYPVDLAAVTREAVATVRLGNDDAVVETDLEGRAPVQANALLSSVVENLVGNAVEHNDTDRPHVHVSVRQEDDRVALRVADDGPGFPPDRREEAFEPSGRGDHGFGLYLTRSLVERYGGTIEVSDNDPRGSVVTATFLSADADEEPADRSGRWDVERGDGLAAPDAGRSNGDRAADGSPSLATR